MGPGCLRLSQRSLGVYVSRSGPVTGNRRALLSHFLSSGWREMTSEEETGNYHFSMGIPLGIQYPKAQTLIHSFMLTRGRLQRKSTGQTSRIARILHWYGSSTRQALNPTSPVDPKPQTAVSASCIPALQGLGTLNP